MCVFDEIKSLNQKGNQSCSQAHGLSPACFNNEGNVVVVFVCAVSWVLREPWHSMGQQLMANWSMDTLTIARHYT